MPRTEEQSQPREEKVEQQKEQEEQAPVTAAVASVALETLESLPAPLKKLATAPPSETESEDDDSETEKFSGDRPLVRAPRRESRSSRPSTRGTVSRNINADVKESNRRVSRRRADSGMTSSTKHNERSRRATFASKQDALAASTRSSSDRVEDALRSDGYIYWSAGWCRTAATPTAPRPTELLEGDVKLLCMLIYKKIAYSATSNKHAIHVTASCCRRRGIEDRAGATDFFAAGVRTHIGGGLVHDGGHTKLSALDKGALQSRVQILAVQRSQQQLLQRHLELSVALQRGRGSANLTAAAWNRNDEFLVQTKGPPGLV
ncbi:hypothetical protein PI124_g8943 [Phytophthora idaei]|nr:hypothetical protein PI124_g8943 [Phytophthora idaei]